MILSVPDQNIVLNRELAGHWRVAGADGQIHYEGEIGGLSEIQLTSQQMLTMEASLVSEIATSSLSVSGSGSIHLINLDSSPVDLRLSNFLATGDLSIGLTPGAAVQLSSQTSLGNFSLLLEVNEDLSMTAAQADGRGIFRDTSSAVGHDTGSLYITRLEDMPHANFSNVQTFMMLTATNSNEPENIEFSGAFPPNDVVAIGAGVLLDVRQMDVADLPLAFGVMQGAKLALSAEQRFDWVGRSGFDPIVNAGQVEISGTELDDHMFGTIGDDLIYSLQGADNIIGGIGADTMFGGEGDDHMYGGRHSDRLDGESGDDQLFGGARSDVLEGGIGNDILYGGNGQDDLFGGADNDQLYGGRHTDNLTGGSGDDQLFGGTYDDVLYGGTGNDMLDGGGSRDELYGGIGNDVLTGGGSHDQLYGGEGDDTFVASIGDRADIYVGDDGTGNVGVDTLDMSAITANITVDFGAGFTQSSQTWRDTITEIENVVTGSGDDTIVANEVVNVMDGGDGNDIFRFQTTDDANGDTIMNFEAGDVIDLSFIDANAAAAGDGAFTLVTGGLTGAGQLSVSYEARDDGTYAVIEGSTTSAATDFTLNVKTDLTLTTSDFGL